MDPQEMRFDKESGWLRFRLAFRQEHTAHPGHVAEFLSWWKGLKDEASKGKGKAKSRQDDGGAKACVSGGQAGKGDRGKHGKIESMFESSCSYRRRIAKRVSDESSTNEHPEDNVSYRLEQEAAEKSLISLACGMNAVAQKMPRIAESVGQSVLETAATAARLIKKTRHMKAAEAATREDFYDS